MPCYMHKFTEDLTLLRWAGSKRKLLPKLINYCPPVFDTYIEPFAGSARLFFQLQPRRAVISDINPHLIQMYGHLKRNSDDVWRALSSLPIGEPNYYTLRSEFNRSENSPRKAALFIYLNRYCFNGLYRTDLDGRFNVPFGGKRNGKLPHRQGLASPTPDAGLMSQRQRGRTPATDTTENSTLE